MEHFDVLLVIDRSLLYITIVLYIYNIVYVAGICVKTRTVGREKIFVNVCTSDKIPPPEDISDTRLLELLNDEVPAYTIPMSIGFERMEADKCK